MTYQKLLSYTRKAVDEFHMIEDGDFIAIGVSGGKDSLSLALALKGLQRFYPKKFELHAFTVSLGFDGFDASGVAGADGGLPDPLHRDSDRHRRNRV